MRFIDSMLHFEEGEVLTLTRPEKGPIDRTRDIFFWTKGVFQPYAVSLNGGPAGSRTYRVSDTGETRVRITTVGPGGIPDIGYEVISGPDLSCPGFQVLE